MAKVRLERIKIARLPYIRPTEEVLHQIAAVLEGSIIDNIMSQTTITGGRIRMNDVTTRALKARLGLPNLSLVFRNHSFIQGNNASWKVTTTIDGNNGTITVEPANEKLRTVMIALQQRGYTGWFGISPKAMAAIREVWREFILEQLRS